MITQEQIEALKENTAVTKYLHPKLLSVAKEIQRDKKRSECFFEYLSRGKWLSASTPCWENNEAYRLRPDYKPASGIVECEIFTNGEGSDSPSLMYAKEGDPTNYTYLYRAQDHPDFIGICLEGWLFGRLYKNKKDPSIVHYMILRKDLPLYDVIPMTGGHVLFREVAE